MSSTPALRSSLMVALDVDDLMRVHQLVEDLEDVVGCFKLGPRLIHRFGEKLVREISNKVPVFVDCKFFDIPSTMEASVRSCFEAGASFATIHALCGPEALEAMARLEEELSKHRPFKILNVTILTSWDEDHLVANFQKLPILDHVKLLVDQVRKAGMDGIVCSPRELSELPADQLYCVTPGVRLGGDPKSDQKRTLSPTEAFAAGAKAIVVGRPIVDAKNPREAALDYAVSTVKL